MERIMRHTATTLGILFLLTGHSLSVEIIIRVSVEGTSIQNENYITIMNDSCLHDWKYRIKPKHDPPHNFTVALIHDGEIIDEYQNNSANLEVGFHNFQMKTEFVKNGTIIRLSAFGSNSRILLYYSTTEKGNCSRLSDVPTVRTTYPTTLGQQHQPQKQIDYRNWFMLLLLLVLIVAVVVTVKYRKRILTMYRENAGNRHDTTVIRETNVPVTPAQFSIVNGQPVIDQTSSLLKNSSIDLCINDEDYAELRTSDVDYAVPDIRASQASLCSFASFEDESTTTDDGRHHQSRHYSMSALNHQNYAQPGTNNNISSRSVNTLPVYSTEDYMSMGGSFPSINHYDQPSSSNHSLSAENGSSVKTQFAKDQEDYVAMFTQEENYSNIGRKPGESFRDKKGVRKNRHKNDEK